MAISIKILTVDRPDMEQLRVVIRFSDAGLTIDREYRFTTSDDLSGPALRARVRADRDALAALTQSQTVLTALVGQELG